VLTSLKPPSPASYSGPREVERLLQTTPQLPGAMPMTSPPESYPEKHRDTAESPRVPPVSKWLQTRFKKAKKNQASQPPDRLSTKSGQVVDLLDSQSQPTANTTRNGRSRFSAGQRQAVSVFFFGRQQVCCMSDEVSQRTVGKSVDWVRCSVCPLMRCLSCMTA
jgi:hypothetical protein